jgi:hypothetical protein
VAALVWAWRHVDVVAALTLFTAYACFVVMVAAFLGSVLSAWLFDVPLPPLGSPGVRT